MSLEAVVGELVAELRKTNTYLSALSGSAAGIVQVNAPPEKSDPKPVETGKPAPTGSSALAYADVTKVVLAVVAKFNKDKVLGIYDSIKPGVKKLPEMPQEMWPAIVSECSKLLDVARMP